VPEAVVSGTEVAGQVVAAGSQAGGVEVVGDGGVVAVAAGHAVDVAPTQLTCGDAFSEVVAWLSCPTGTVAMASSVLLLKLVSWPPAD
jgi:hypothetical protein